MSREWHADEILEIGRAFQPMCVLAAAAELDLFGLLAPAPLTAEEAAGRLEADLRGTRILLDAVAALGLLEKEDGRYAVPESLVPFLTEDHEQSVLAMTRHQANCMRRWAQLAYAVKTGVPAVRIPSIRGEDADREAFIEAMNDINRSVAPVIVEELAVTGFTHLLDVGGASGTWTMAWLAANEGATATLFDLPEVVPQAKERLARFGFADRVTLVGGDFSNDPLPEGADLAWVSAIVHQHSREENRSLFRKVFDALTPGGRVLVRDIVMEEARTKPLGGALFAINMLVGTAGGGTFTYAELEEDLEAAGFADVDWIWKDEWMHNVVRAVKPGS
jgi:precorrin-6B methylase 2